LLKETETQLEIVKRKYLELYEETKRQLQERDVTIRKYQGEVSALRSQTTSTQLEDEMLSVLRKAEQEMELMKASYQQDLNTLAKEKKLDETLLKSEIKNLQTQLQKMKFALEQSAKSHGHMRASLDSLRAVCEQQKMLNNNSPLVLKIAHDVKTLYGASQELKSVLSTDMVPGTTELLKFPKRE
jgi:chromosome segregation ATPase